MSRPPPLPPKKPARLFEQQPPQPFKVGYNSSQPSSGVLVEHASSFSTAPSRQTELSVSDPTSVGNCVKVTGYDQNDSTEFETFLSYVIEVSLTDGGKHVARKRFSEFVAFHGRWTKIYPGIKHIAKPKKKLFVRSSDKELRRMELQSYLRTVSRVGALRYELADFLGMSPKSLQAALSPTKSPRKAGWGQEASAKPPGHIRGTLSMSALPQRSNYAPRTPARTPATRVQAAPIPSYTPPPKPTYAASSLWEEFTDDDSGDPYWHNTDTGEVTWDRPRELESSVSNGESNAPTVPSRSAAMTSTVVWEEYVDDDSGDPYWHNVETGEVTWDKPRELERRQRPTSMTRIASQRAMNRRSRNDLEDGSVRRPPPLPTTSAVPSAASGRRRSGEYGDPNLPKRFNEPRGGAPDYGRDGTMTLAEVQALKGRPEFDKSCLERYLSPAAFQAAFGMDRASFDRLAGWKRTDLKRAARIF